MLSSIVKSSSLYAIGTIARAASSILMLPLYTRYLSPEIYGTAELLNLILDLTVLLLGARITTGMFKFYADANTSVQKNTIISTCLWLGLLINSIAVIILWFLAPVIANLLNNDEMTTALQWFSFTLAFGIISEIGMGYFRANDKAGHYLFISLIKLVIQITASIYFIVYKELGLWGIIYSAIISSGLQALILLAYILPSIGIKFSKKVSIELIKYSLPIIIASIAMYYMTFGDRYFIQLYHNATEVGLYALGYKFGFILTALIWSPFMSYWGAKQFDHSKADNCRSTFSQVFYGANYILWMAATGMVIFAGPTIHLMADSAYYDAIKLVPFIVLAYTFQCWTEFHRFGLLETGNTKYLNYYTWLTAIFISILYIWLIPKYGGLGAAIATTIAMLFRFILIYRKSQFYFSFPTQWNKIIGLITLSFFGFFCTDIFFTGGNYDFLTGSIIFIITIIFSVFIKCVPMEVTQAYLKFRLEKKSSSDRENI